MIEIQNEMSERAIELLALPEDEPCFVLDIGCGSGKWFHEKMSETDGKWKSNFTVTDISCEIDFAFTKLLSKNMICDQSVQKHEFHSERENVPWNRFI